MADTVDWRGQMIAQFASQEARERERLPHISEYEKLSRRIVQLQRGLAPADSHRAEHHEPELRAECQRLRHVADQYRDQIERLTADVRELTERSGKLQHDNEGLRELVQEKNRNIQLWQDELLTYQLSLNVLEDKNAKLEADNAELVARWMAKMGQVADDMNNASGV